MSEETEKLNNSFMVISIVINVIKPLLEIFNVVAIGSVFEEILMLSSWQRFDTVIYGIWSC